MMKVWSLMMLLAFVLSAPVSAQQVRFGPQGESRLQVTQLSTIVSNDGETKNAFLARAGRFFHNYTQNNSFEACASVCATPSANQWGIVATTNEAHVGCVVTNRCPSGMQMVGESIHSHPAPGRYKVNAADLQLNSVRSTNLRRTSMTSVSAVGFSPTDRAAGPGYLVELEQLLYFDGTKQTVVGPLADRVFPEQNN